MDGVNFERASYSHSPVSYLDTNGTRSTGYTYTGYKRSLFDLKLSTSRLRARHIMNVDRQSIYFHADFSLLLDYVGKDIGIYSNMHVSNN